MPRSQICGKVLYRGSRHAPPGIALTFDDGPNATVTPEILECLKRRGVKAAFFVVGKHAERLPHLVKRIDAEGHIIGNHSFEHAHLGMMRWQSYWDQEIRRTDAVIQDIIGKRPALFRPPMGFKTLHLTRAARRHGHTLVTWSRRGCDGVRTTASQVISRLGDAQSGDVILLHDGAVAPFQVNPGATASAIDHLLGIWGEQGLLVRRLDELLEVPAYAPRDVTQSDRRADPCSQA